jgi:DNA repair exonuclease SbcCD ATPase subunit
MIPRRVKLKGFLSYKDEQEICFDGASLWMLAGCNGSGKSAVFDAVTYALFGYHRGGSHDAHELINKDSDRAAIEFDFTLEGQPYQALRTIQRTKHAKGRATQQVYRRLADGGKQAVPDTNLRAGFDAWVAQNIGLTYETFTSSVLLLQGRAEKLLDSTAKGRFEVLAGIVDLDRYERLYQCADAERKALDVEVQTLKAKRDAVPEVTGVDLAEAAASSAAAEEARQQTQADVERLQELEFRARQWAELQNQLAGARRRWQEAQALLADAPAIERDVQRLRELRDVLPALQTIVEQRGQINTTDAQIVALALERAKLDKQQVERESALQQTRHMLATLNTSVAANVTKHREVAAQLRQAATLLERLKEYERQENELASLEAELARLPRDPADLVHKAQEAHDQVALVAQVVPLLARLQVQRDELGQARGREQTAAEGRPALQLHGEKVQTDVARLKSDQEAAQRACHEADAQATRAQTLLEQARGHMGELGRLNGATVCRQCGQPLTAAHLRAEQRHRSEAVTEAEGAFRQTAGLRQAAQQRERLLREELAAAEKSLLDARETFRDLQHQADQARKDVERLLRECGQTYTELPLAFRTRVGPDLPADWLATLYPSAAELEELRLQANALEASRRRLRDAQHLTSQWTRLKGQEASTRQILTRLRADLPGDPQAVRQEHVRLESEEQVLDRTLAAERAQAVDLQKELDRLAHLRDQAHKLLADLQGRLSTAEASLRHARQLLERALKTVPDAWQAAAERAGLKELTDWHQERDELVRKQTDERGRQVDRARHGVTVLGQAVASLESQQDQCPPNARQEPSTIQSLLQQARQALRTRDEALGEARHRQALLDGQQRQRHQLEQELLRAEQERTQFKILAELLGRDRLQLHLVRQAERQVVAHANAVLDRLSTGQLYLRLSGAAGAEGEGGPDQALALEVHNRVTCDKPISVAFLSGSQKFRVAVSLALGIGQYASRRHRPIEAVIIDEGFGCLDRQGRQVMIQELQNLRGQVRCILLVSHQEEFADAFADGYRFELRNGTTVATRYQR